MIEEKSYKSEYADEKSTCEAIMINNGSRLEIEIFSVTFSGSSFDELKPSIPISSNLLKRFKLYKDTYLCNFCLTIEIPVNFN